MKLLKLYIFVVILSIFPIIDIFKTPDLPHTSDGITHVARMASFYKEFTSGQFPVRWASQFNFGYGMPFFNFYHPLPYAATVPLIWLGISVIDAFKLSLLATYILAGIFTLLFSLKYFKDEKVALLVTIMYQFAPYRMVDMLVRANLGTLYAYALAPLLLYSYLIFLEKKTYPRFFLISLLTAAITMTHNLMGIIFLTISLLIILIHSLTLKERLMIIMSSLAGIMLASFFLIPAFVEKKYTYGYLLTKDLFYEHFAPFINFFIPNLTNSPNLRTAEISVQIGFFHTISLVLMVILLIKARLSIRQRRLAFLLIIITLLTLFFMQPTSKFIWENIPLVRQFQFPWRFLGVINFTTSLGSFAFLGYKFFQKKIVYFTLIIAVVLSSIYYWIPYQGYQKFNNDYFWKFSGSTTYFGEINSIWMAGEPKGFPEKRIDLVAGSADISKIKLNSVFHSFNVNATASATLVDKTQFYPGWKVKINGIHVPIEFQDQNYRGLITFQVPKGNHYVEVVYEENKLQFFSDAVSLITLLLLVIGLIIFRNKRYAKITFC